VRQQHPALTPDELKAYREVGAYVAGCWTGWGWKGRPGLWHCGVGGGQEGWVPCRKLRGVGSGMRYSGSCMHALVAAARLACARCCSAATSTVSKLTCIV